MDIDNNYVEFILTPMELVSGLKSGVFTGHLV